MLESKILNRIYRHPRGWCMTAKDFQNLGQDAAIRQALRRLVIKNKLRRLAQGLYESPRQHPKLGILPPDTSQIIKAIESRDHIRTQPTGAYAANLLGLTEQVPSRIVVLTEASSKKLKVGSIEILFKNTTPKNMALSGTTMGLIVQALRHLGNGKGKLTLQNKHKLKAILQTLSHKELTRGKKYSPAWIRDLLHQLLESTND